MAASPRWEVSRHEDWRGSHGSPAIVCMMTRRSRRWTNMRASAGFMNEKDYSG